MKSTINNWYVITGAPSSGKSTLIRRLSELRYTTIEEMGRKLIDHEMSRGKTLEQVNVDSPEFEEAWVRIQSEVESTLNREDVIFFDRGIIDTLGYFDYYSWPITSTINRLLANVNYKKVFLLEMLDYDKDYYRIEDAETARQLHGSFKKVYKDKGYEVIEVPRDTVESRTTFILNHIG